MISKNIYRLLFPLAVLLLPACTKYLDKTNPDTEVDPSYWRDENSVRTYNWEFYNLFPGFGNGTGTGDFYFTAFTDDQVSSSFSQFPVTTAASNGDWNFSMIRKANIMLQRVDGVDMDSTAKRHWKGIAHFFRAFQYFKLVQEFGGVPFFNSPLDISDSTQIYKPRDSHQLVMDSVLADINYAVANLRVVDLPNTVNQNVALALKSRICLFEGTYRKYHPELNLPNADLYLQQAKDAAAQLMATGTYSLAADYRTSYSSLDLSSDKEMILYKQYLAGFLTHSVIGYTNSTTLMNGPSKSAVDSYVCSDGLPIQLSPLYKGDATIQALRTNRDKRLLETIDTFYCYAGSLVSGLTSSSGYRPSKFLQPADVQQSPNNTTDAPIFWLAEVYLNYAEACAELDQLGKYTIVQADLDQSINKLRQRAGIKALTLTGPQTVGFADPAKDADVTPLIWEIRRERRVELMMDGFRFQDIMRWKKGVYMDSQKNPNSFLGARVTPNNTVHLDANGYIIPYAAGSVRTFTDPKNYLSAIPTSQILLYPTGIQQAMQNPGW
ncbi:RagB/SusD family nutrient uptake outer membrane protein [Puia sp.]|uniref:RagB/SusD family nutrient uptake outer membrane protein n=1 Tax=Puia sp. TaxID=2045100 RepID=UPI002F3FC228